MLADNEAQTLALVIARRQALPMVNVHARYIDVLETEGWLDRGLEFLPTDKQIAERQAAGAGLTTPEFAVLIAYTKNANVAEIVRSDLPDEPAARGRPASTTSRRRCASASRRRSASHPLRREIIATAARQPDGQPVGHLVRPPHDRGHRRLGGRRDPGVGRGPRACSTSRGAVGRDRRPRRAWCPDGHPARPVPRLPADGRARRRCGCCATVGRRSTSPATVAQFRPGITELAASLGPMLRRAGWPTSCMSGEASRLAAGVPEDLAERAGAVAAAAHRVRHRRAVGLAPGARSPSWPRVAVGAVRRAST